MAEKRANPDIDETRHTTIWPIPALPADVHNEPVIRSLPLLAVLASLPSFGSDDPIAKGRALYDAARQAATGGQALRDISYDRVTKIKRQDDTVVVQSSVQIVLPATSRTEMRAGGAATVLVFDGESVRNLSAGGRALPAKAADLQRRELARVLALFGPEPAEGTVRYRGKGEVDGRPVEIIELFDVGDTALRLFLDRETRDVLKRMYVGDAPDGSMAQVEEYLSDYKTIGGIRWPHSMRTTRNGQPGPSSRLTGVQVNQSLSASEITR